MTAAAAPPFGELLRRYRTAAGLTQEELAARSGLTPQGIGLLERGERLQPQAYTVHALADALGLVDMDRARFTNAAKGRTGHGPSRSGTGAAGEGERFGPPFIGRTRELSLVQRHLDGDAPPVLLLAGEPGIGKSRLLSEAAGRAESAGWAVLAGGCQRRGREEPYSPLRAAVQRHLGVLSPAALRRALQDCAWLVRLVPELGLRPIEPLPRWTVSPDQERRLMFEAVARFLHQVAGPAGTFLVLDDVQWAGRDALDLLASLVPSPAAPVRIMGAYRDTGAAHDGPLATLLFDLARAGLVQHLPMSPLAPEEAQQLLDHLLAGTITADSTIRERVVQRTGGVPFFVVSYAQALRLGQAETGDGAEVVPWDVAQSVRQRVVALPEATRGVLAAAAVAGRAVRLDILVDVTLRTEDDILDALDAACAMRLLDEDAQGYRFAHDVVWEVVEADVSQSRRLVWHRRVAQALERTGDEALPDLVAYHYGQSDAPDRALPYLERAGERAEAQSAVAAAAEHYGALVARLDGLGRVQEAARVREKLATVVMAMAQYDAALQTLEQAAETYRTAGDMDGLGRVAGQIGRVHTSKGTPDDGLHYLLPLLRDTEAAGLSAGLAAMYAALPNLYYFKGAYAERLATAERAAELARAAGDERNLVRAEFEHGSALADLGRVAEALDVLEGARRRAEVLDDQLNVRRILFKASESYRRQGECAAASGYLAQALAIAERLGEVAQIAYLTAHRGQIGFVLGHWDQARADCERAVTMSRPFGMTFATLYSLLQAGRQYVALGEWQEAARYLEECLDLSQRGGTFQTARGARAALAERELLRGNPAAAHAHLASLIDRPRLEELPLLAWVHLAQGRGAKANDIAAQAIARARAGTDRLTLIEALWVQGMVMTEQKQWGEATQALEDGLALARAVPYPYAAARLLYVAGLLQVQQGCPGPARERLEEALALFRRLGARWYVEQVTQALADRRS